MSFRIKFDSHRNYKLYVPKGTCTLQTSHVYCNIQPRNCIKAGMASLTASGTKGSMTIEAAMILPFFLYAAAVFLYFIQILCAQTYMQHALYSAGKEAAAKAYIYEAMSGDGDPAGNLELGTDLVTASYIQAKVERSLKHNMEMMNRSYSLTRVMGEEETVDAAVQYQMELPCNIFGLPPLQFVQRARLKAWTGYVRNTGADSGEEIVYVTENGTVYHRSLECTHINLSIRQVSMEQAAIERNEHGGKYHPCERCIRGAEAPGSVYITNWGDRYHNSYSCSGLKRNIRSVPVNEAGNLRACSKCGGAK